MNTQLVEIQPRELKFTCELKKQSSCAVHLLNATDQYVAFKVKTTSPKKYCVRPNVGIIKPRSTYDFTVTMQAQKSVPSDLQCKDKFLLQSTVVPYGTSEEEITSNMFAKESQKYIEETKLRVVLTSTPSSPVKPHTSVFSLQEPSNDISMPKEPYSPVLLPVNGVNKQERHYEAPIRQDTVQNGVEDSVPPDLLKTKPVEAVKFVKNIEEPRSLKVVDSEKPIPAKVEEFYADRDDTLKHVKDLEEVKTLEHVKDLEDAKTLEHVKDLEEVKLKLMKEIEELRSQIGAMDVKLVEAEYTIEKLKVKKSDTTIREKETSKQDLAMSSQKGGMRKVQVGFPPLFVCMVALVSLIVGTMFRA